MTTARRRQGAGAGAHMLALLAVLAALGAASAGSPAAAHAAGTTAKGYTQPIYHQQPIDEVVRVRTSHGTLYGNIRRPRVPAGVRVPILLTYSPYNADLGRRTVARDGFDEGYPRLADYYVPRGYARAMFDLLGTGESGGCWDWGGEREQSSGAELVEALAALPWSNGRVAMVGNSYEGTTALAVAVKAPPALTTIVPMNAIARWYDYLFVGGIRRASPGAPATFDLASPSGLRGTHPPTDTEDPLHAVEVAAARAHPCDRVPHHLEGFSHDPVYDAFWDERDYAAKATDITASVLLEGGWLDTNVLPHSSLQMWGSLPPDHPKKLVMARTNHSVPDGRPLFEDWVDVRHAWLDYWLYGFDGLDDDDDLPDTGVMRLPAIDTATGSGFQTLARQQLAAWPPETGEVGLPLVGVATAPSDLVLQNEDSTFRSREPVESWEPASASDPRVEQHELVANDCSDSCLVFLSGTLDQPLRVVGAPVVDLRARSVPDELPADQVSTQYVTALWVIPAQGPIRILATGMLNSRNRDGERTSTGVVAGQPYSARVRLTPLDEVIPAGSRLGIGIASSVAATWGNLAPDDDPATRNEVLLGAGDAGSVLRLPVAPPFP